MRHRLLRRWSRLYAVDGAGSVRWTFEADSPLGPPALGVVVRAWSRRRDTCLSSGRNRGPGSYQL